MNDDKVIKLRDLNAAFRDPRKISMAYFQGSVVVDYLMETYGAGAASTSCCAPTARAWTPTPRSSRR